MSAKVYGAYKVVEKRDKNNNEVKSFWYQIGAAFPIAQGGFSVEIPDEISITGRLVISPRVPPKKEKNDS